MQESNQCLKNQLLRIGMAKAKIVETSTGQSVTNFGTKKSDKYRDIPKPDFSRIQIPVKNLSIPRNTHL